MRTVLKQDKTPKSLHFLYETRFGGFILRIISRRWLSRLAGVYLDSRISRVHIKKYIKRHNIALDDYVTEKYKSFNAFFTRRIKPELRPFDFSPEAFLSPCDAKLSAYEINGDSKFAIKGFEYSVESLVKDEALAKKYDGGLCLVFRLTVSDYHRYFFVDDGSIESNKFIKGRLHTVQPAALENRRVFSENCREVTVLNTAHFGTVTQVEVGAMMVGRIVNNKHSGAFQRGEEKGRFEFGGSTVVLLVEKGKAEIDAEFFVNTANNLETVVRCGEKIGTKTV